MGTDDAATCRTVFCTLLLLTLSCDCLAADLDLAQTAVLEEINHAGAGGIWAELISNRGNYLMFYNAIREAYPDIQIISNCDGSSKPLHHPADLYDFHVYSNATFIFLMKDKFTRTSRKGPKVFVSEYAVNDAMDAGNGSLLASLAEAAFLIGLEKNSWNPDAIVFNSWQQYGTPSYWMQTFFRESSGSVIHPARLASSYSSSLAASAITWKDNEDMFLRIKVVPVRSGLPGAAEKMQALLVPYSLTSFDLALDQYGELVAEM
ncbi:hypothetical protein ACQ4PT_070661 [Festuca glaucescens]